MYFYPKQGGYGKPWFNILNERDNSYQNIDKNSLNFSAQLDYNILDDLKLSTTFSYAISNTNEDVYHGEDTFYCLNLAKKDFKDPAGHYESSSWMTATLLPYGGELKRNETRNKNYMARVQVNYNLFLDENHDHLVQIMAGGVVIIKLHGVEQNFSLLSAGTGITRRECRYGEV